MFASFGMIFSVSPDPGFEQWLMLRLRALSSPELDQLMFAITTLGNFATLAIVCALVSLSLLRRAHARRAIALIWLALALGQGINQLLKATFQRARPQLWERLLNPESSSFPSGHAMASMAVYGCAAFLLGQAFPQHRRAIWSVTIPLILLIGLSRVWLGVHWPTDVLAGFAAGLIILFVIIRLHSRGVSSERATDQYRER
jgi:undecaprenyl-diphosphatase